MARSFTRSQIRTQALFLADLDAATKFAPAANVNDLINNHLARVWEWLISEGIADYATATTDGSTTSGTLSYSLPATFLRETAVYARESTEDGAGVGPNKRRPLMPIVDWERASLQAPSAVYTYAIEYYTAAPVWTSDSDSFDGIAGAERLIAVAVARDLCVRRERATELSAMIADEEARLRRAVKRQTSGPRMIRDVRDTRIRYWDAPTVTALVAYRIRGTNLELYEGRVFP